MYEFNWKLEIYKYFWHHLNREFFFIFFLISPTSGSFLFCAPGHSSDDVEFWEDTSTTGVMV